MKLSQTGCINKIYTLKLPKIPLGLFKYLLRFIQNKSMHETLLNSDYSFELSHALENFYEHVLF